MKSLMVKSSSNAGAFRAMISGSFWSRAGLVLFLAVLTHQVSQAQGEIQGSAHNEYPGKQWTQDAKPEDRGWSSDRLAAAKAYADSIDTAAVVIVDDGVIVSQWGAITTKFKVHSIRKSFL